MQVEVLVDLVPVKKEHLGVEAALVLYALMLLVTEPSMIFLVSEVSLARPASCLGMMRKRWRPPHTAPRFSLLTACFQTLDTQPRIQPSRVDLSAG